MHSWRAFMHNPGQESAPQKDKPPCMRLAHQLASRKPRRIRRFACVCASQPGAKLTHLGGSPSEAQPPHVVNPFFFGSSDKQLFGVHHAPEGAEVRDGAVLLCPSLGHEYIAGHASLTQLGQHLARQGLHVLRFDFYGCGDSAGDIEDASVEQWIEDVGTALQELRDTSGSRRVSVIGLRLGASIAALAAAQMQSAGGPEIQAAVLWEPVVSGSEYLQGLARLENRWLGAMYVKPPRDLEGCDGPEVMGHLLPESICEELRRINLQNLPARPAEKILLMQNNEDEHLAGLHSSLSVSNNGVVHESIPASAAWFGEHWATVALPPVEVLRRIAEWVRGVYS